MSNKLSLHGKTAGQWLDELQKDEEALAQINFEPSTKMQMAKSRFWKALELNPIVRDPTSLTLSQLAKMAGERSFTKWLENKGFLFWFLDKSYEELEVESWYAPLTRMLFEVAMSDTIPKELTAKDKIAAANLLLTLADKFPNKRREFVYVDKELGKMSEQEVERELAVVNQMLDAEDKGS